MLLRTTSTDLLALGYNNTDEVYLNATALYPATSDGSALGSATKMWSDAFLADGGVVNFNNGATVLTHTTANLDVSTGTLSVGSVAVATIDDVEVSAINAQTDTAHTLIAGDR